MWSTSSKKIENRKSHEVVTRSESDGTDCDVWVERDNNGRGGAEGP